MSQGNTSKSWLRKASVLVLAVSVCGGSVACSKKKQEDGKAEAEKTKAESEKKAPTGDRYKDGQRLAAAVKDWQKRWADTADLPPCDPLLKDAAELELCKTAAASLVAMKAAVAKPEPEGTQIHLAAELAYATEAASEKLRNASMAKLQEERKATAAPGSSGKPLPAPGASAKARAAASSKLGDKLKDVQAAPADPGMQVMQAYSRANRASLRYLSQFLQFGPLPTRQAAFNELEALSKRKEAWPAVGRTLREAAMAENDTDLQGKLKALAPKMSRRDRGVMPASPGMMPKFPPGSTPPSMPQGLPPGHPAMPHDQGADAPPRGEE
ncbi:MAG: hypothetical protein EOO73_17630 [Myxococcales bacterium]|nr:MAG: hypothetical protein EOO73_17630 [Myxococcales bacterium]